MKEKLLAFLTTPLGSFLRVAVGIVVAAVLAAVQADGVSNLATLDWWQATIAGAIGAALPVLFAWLNPQDPRFGVGSPDSPVASSE